MTILVMVIIMGVLVVWLGIVRAMVWGPREPYAKRAVVSLSQTDDTLEQGLVRVVEAHNTLVRALADELGLEVEHVGREVVWFPEYSVRILTFCTTQPPPKLVRSKK